MFLELYQALENKKFKSKNIKLGELKILLDKIYKCYEAMANEHKNLCNNEEDIRDILLLEYMKNYEVKHNLCNIVGFRFEREGTEDHKTCKDDKMITGRVDIKILPTNGIDSDNDKAYFVIECKRLDNNALKGSSGLNAEYIKNGVIRFVTKQYKSYYKVNAMIGFVVSPIDIDLNISNINYVNTTHFKNTSRTIQDLIAIDNSKMYHSIHKNIDGDNIDILHLMMDFSKNIVNSKFCKND